MGNHSKPEIYFHVGLGKAASTYLQYNFFPKLKGIHYIQRTKYRHYRQIVERSSQDRFLVSNEFDRQLEREVKKIAAVYPHAGVIMVLRRHDGWIASQYRRHVKNGSALSFPEFFDLDHDSGFWKKNDLWLYPKIALLEHHFSRKPLVLIYDDLKKNPHEFFRQIAAYTGTTYDPNEISLTAKHRSYTEKQLKWMRYCSRYLFKENRKDSEIRWLKRLNRIRRQVAIYTILYSAFSIPDRWLSAESLIPENALAAVRDCYKEDWEKCLDFAAKCRIRQGDVKGLPELTG